MDILEKFIRKVAYKFPKGYPDMSDPKDVSMLYELLEYDMMVAEAAGNRSFSDAIKKQLNTDEIPEPQGAYSVHPGELKIDNRDLPTFKELFTVVPDQGIGNGEVALYWLFSGRAEETHGEDAPDLMIDGTPVEVKAYPSHEGKIGLGKFKGDQEVRSKLTKVFGIANLLGIEKLIKVKGKEVTQDFVSEVGFNTDDVYESFRKVLMLKQGLATLGTELKGEGSPFAAIEKQVNQVIPDAMPGTVDEQAEALTKALFIEFITNKLSKKPGEGGGYIANINPKNYSIKFFKIPTQQDLITTLKNKTLAQIKDSVAVSSGELKLNYNLL